MEPCDLIEIVQENVQNQHYENPQRYITVELPSLQQVLILADVDRIGQVVSNYLSNAHKYSPPDSPIEVHIAVNEQSVRVSIRDEGPGLQVEEQELIWERFYRAKGIEVQSGSGVSLGPGLHICRTIIERHGEQVGVASTPAPAPHSGSHCHCLRKAMLEPGLPFLLISSYCLQAIPFLLM